MGLSKLRNIEKKRMSWQDNGILSRSVLHKRRVSMKNALKNNMKQWIISVR